MDLPTALQQLDAGNDDHWTADGLPRVEVVSGLIGNDVTRKQITNAAPTLTREGLLKANEAAEAETEAEPEPSDPADRPELETERPDEGDVAFVEPQDEVVTMTVDDVVAGGRPLVERALAEFARQNDVLVKRRDRILEQIADVGRRSELLTRVLNRLPKSGHGDGLQAYLAQQKKNREARAEKTRRFIEAGTTPGEVAAALDPRAQIDVAMNKRGAKRGETRPARPVNTGATPTRE